MPPGKKWYSDPMGAALAAEICFSPLALYPRSMNSALDAWMMRSRVVDTAPLSCMAERPRTRTIILVKTIDVAHDTQLRTDTWLVGAAGLFTAAVLIHNSDHVRRGADAVTKDVFWVGTASILLEVALVVLACQRHRFAPLAATAGGFSLAAGYVLVHFLPARGWLSDSFTSATNVSPLSWIAASLEVLAAITLGVVGLIVLRARGGLASATRPHPEQRSLRTALLHPVALTMIAGNVAVLVATFSQL